MVNGKIIGVVVEISGQKMIPEVFSPPNVHEQPLFDLLGQLDFPVSCIDSWGVKPPFIPRPDVVYTFVVYGDSVVDAIGNCPKLIQKLCGDLTS